MKLLALALLVTLPAFAADKEETIHTNTMVDVHELSCVVRAGQEGKLEDRLNTMLGNPAGTHTVVRGSLIELQHKSAFANGCRLEHLDTISARAMQFFGFLHDVPTEVKKLTTEPFRNGNGNCVVRFMETVHVDLGNGIVLSDMNGEIRPSADCR